MTVPTSADNRCDGLTAAFCIDSGGSCVADRCVAPPRSYSYVLVVSLPSSSFYAPGYVFPFSTAPFPFGKTDKCLEDRCFTLPSLAVTDGRYDVVVATAAQLGAAVGVTSGPPVTIPARVAFRPRWTFDEGSYDAYDVGLPLLPLFGALANRPPTETTRGPFGGVVPSYHALLPPGVDYEIDALPATPYEATLPPRAELAIPQQATLLLGDTGRSLDDAALRTTSISRDAGSLDGFQSWLEDSIGGRRISTLETLSGAATTVVYRTLGQATRFDVDKPTVNLLVAPPPGTITLPTLVASQVTGRVSDSVRYPQLPPPVFATGYVGDASLIAAQATLRFRATRIETAESGTIGRALRYDVSVDTDSTGRYVTVLPPGTYKVDISPADTKLALQQFDLVVASGGETKRTFRLPARVTVGGLTRLWNGTPLAFGQVTFAPSASYRSARLRGETTVLAPRATTVSIGSAGGFAARLDPGIYDVIVDPPPGSSLARVVRTGFVVAADAALAATVPDIVVPPPSELPLLLRDPESNPLPRALVRAYVRQASETAFVEIAATFADDDGSATLFFGDAPTPIAPR